MGRIAGARILSNVFSSNMVIQRGPQRASFFGSGRAGDTVSVYLANGPSANTTVNADGSWLVRLPPLKAQAGVNITVASYRTAETLFNVAVGEVIFCKF